MVHSWRELLFLHWQFDACSVQDTLPPGLTVDTFNGAAWVGVVPFFMRGIRHSWLPGLPGCSNFQELNCRTYVVDADGIPGVWFYSLDANSRPAVWGARRFYHLPYHHAEMSFQLENQTGRVDFRSRRGEAPPHLASRFVYEPHGRPSVSEPGTLDFFLVERYVLFARRRTGDLYRGLVHHSPYEVAPADVKVYDEALLELNGFERTNRPPEHAMVSRGVDVDVFPLRPVGV